MKHSGRERVASRTQGKGGHFHIDPQTRTVFWNKTQLKMNDSGTYTASVIQGPAKRSESVILEVKEPNISSTGMTLLIEEATHLSFLIYIYFYVGVNSTLMRTISLQRHT